jgi:hypothetical protein
MLRSSLEFDVSLDDLPDEETDEGCSEGEADVLIADTGDALIPDCGMEDDEVERLAVPYSTRGPDDWVSSGPLGPNAEGRPGRHFDTWEAAEVWARRTFGSRFRGRIPAAQFDGANRWAFLVKGPRGQNVRSSSASGS